MRKTLEHNELQEWYNELDRTLDYWKRQEVREWIEYYKRQVEAIERLDKNPPKKYRVHFEDGRGGTRRTMTIEEINKAIQYGDSVELVTIAHR